MRNNEQKTEIGVNHPRVGCRAIHGMLITEERQITQKSA